MQINNYFTVEVLSEIDWAIHIKQFDDISYRQLANYSAVLATRIGAKSENIAIRAFGEIIGLCNVRIRKIPLLHFGIAYINGAPLIKKANCQTNYDHTLLHCLIALREEFVAKRGYVLRVIGIARADILSSATNKCFHEAGYAPCEAKGRYRTILLDINRDLADIRREFNQKWRNKLNKAERQCLQIVSGTESELFYKFSKLHTNLVAKKQFDVDLGPEFFLDLQNGLSESERFVVHLAIQNGQVVAGHIGSYLGDTAIYLLGAANEDGLKSYASYFLQWHVIGYAKRRGCCWYDLGGIDPYRNPNVYEFKARIGGADVYAPGPYEAGAFMRRSFVKIGETLYRWVKQ